MDKEKLEQLLELDVSDYTQEKMGLTYLSWANAWREFIKVYPEATYEIERNENNECWFGNPQNGYMVYTSVTAGGTTHSMWLPVMNYKNKSMTKPTTFDINKAVMRCLTKNLAMFGLGIYIYAGEDLPEKPEDEPQPKQKKEEPKVVNTAQALEIENLINEVDADFEKFKEYFNVKDLSQMTVTQYKKAKRQLESKKDNKQGDDK